MVSSINVSTYRLQFDFYGWFYRTFTDLRNRFTGRIYSNMGAFAGLKLDTDTVYWAGTGRPFGGAHPGITVLVRCDG
jgi:hypothetical protein